MTKQNAHMPSALIGKKIQNTPINAIKPNPHNPISYPETKLAKFAQFISKYDAPLVIVIDKDMQIITGYAHWRAAQIAGHTAVPTVKAEHLNKQEIATFMLADQKLLQSAEWEEDQLHSIFEILYEYELTCDAEYDISLTGFETAEIDNCLYGVIPDEDSSATENLIQEIATKPAISQSGDIWVMGPHRLICGDSNDLQTYARLMHNKQAHLVATDPPYNLKIEGFVSGNGKTRHREFKDGSGEMTSPEYEKFLQTILSHCYQFQHEAALAYIFMDWRHTSELLAAAQSIDLRQINLCVWDKGVGGMGSFYRSQHELVHIFRRGNKQHRNNIMLGKYGRNRSNVWQYPSANMSGEGRAMLKNHPTPKPVPMIMDIIKDVTKTGDIVLDPFMGSGTTLIAAEKTGRISYGIEVDPIYVDLALHRWESLTGKKALHATTGKCFSVQTKPPSSKPVKPRERRREKA